MTDELRKLTADVLAYSHHVQYLSSDFDDCTDSDDRARYLAAAANAAPKLAQAWLETRSEIDRLRAWAVAWKRAAKHRLKHYQLMEEIANSYLPENSVTTTSAAYNIVILEEK